MQGSNVLEDNTGTVPNQMVATFEDTAAADTASTFVATFNWNDGTTGVGTVTGSGGLFQVLAQHAYGVVVDYVGQVVLALATLPLTALVQTQQFPVNSGQRQH